MNSHISLSPSLTVLLCCPCAVTFSKCDRILLLRLGAGEFLLCCQGESWESWAWVVGMERALRGDVPGRAMGVVPALNPSVGVALEPVVPIQPCPLTRGWKIKGILVSTRASCEDSFHNKGREALESSVQERFCLSAHLEPRLS